MLSHILYLVTSVFAGLRNSSFEFIFRINETQYCFEMEVVRFIGPVVDYYRMYLRIASPGFYFRRTRLLIYETISYGKKKKTGK